MINITGNQGFDIFIMQSDENKQKVERYLRAGVSLPKSLMMLHLTKSDFTDSDWKRLGGY